MNASIAVVIPVRNGMPFLPETLASVRAQEYEPLEIVIVDDGSTDNTREFIRGVADLPIQLLERNSIGPSAARNLGVRATTTDFVAFLDADDLWAPGALRCLAAALTARHDAGVAQGLIRNFREAEPGVKQFFTSAFRYLNLGANLWRRSVFDSVGLLDESLRLAEDLDFLMRCWEHGMRKAEVNDVILHYRRHPGNMTQGLSGAGFGTVAAYQRRIERIRSGAFDPTVARPDGLKAFLGHGPADQDANFP